MKMKDGDDAKDANYLCVDGVSIMSTMQRCRSATTMPDKNNVLKPCAHCGGTAKEYRQSLSASCAPYYVSIHCSNCGTMTKLREGAVRDWNARASEDEK